VAFVTTVLLLSVRSIKAPAERVTFLATMEQRFGAQARLTTALAGITGFYMVVGPWQRMRQSATREDHVCR
jgi:hypothetical protein